MRTPSKPLASVARIFIAVCVSLSAVSTAAHAEVYTVWADSGDEPANYELSDLNGTLKTGGERTYTYTGKQYVISRQGRYRTINGRRYAGISFDVTLPEKATFDGRITIKTPSGGVFGKKVFRTAHAEFSVTGEGIHRVFVSWDDFQRKRALDAWKRFIKTISISGKRIGRSGSDASVRISNARLVRADVMAVSVPRSGRASTAGTPATYHLKIRNTSDDPITVTATHMRHGGEEMDVGLDPARVTVPAGGTQTIEVHITPTERVPEGNFEKQTIRLVPNGNATAAETVTLHTSRRLDTPSLIYEPDG
jgi:hypothetical protein